MIRAALQIKRLSLLGLITFILTGCLFSQKQDLVFNEQQSIVMEPSVLAEGIIVEKPVITVENHTAIATIKMSNIQPHPVSVLYRVYWYDQQGLRVDKTADHRQEIPANSTVSVKAVYASARASNVRVYLFLPPKVGEAS